MCKLLGFAECHSIDAVGHEGGLALFWKNRSGVTINSSTVNYIDFEVVNDQVGRWCYTVFMGILREVGEWILGTQLKTWPNSQDCLGV